MIRLTGGTVIEAWSNGDAMEECNPPPPKEKHCNMSSALTDKIARKNCNSFLWNAMMNPLKRNPVKGFLWYQGEANSHTKRKDFYNCTFPAMIKSWRKEFSSHSETNADAPFGFVQLAPYREDPLYSGFPLIRWHQTADYGYVPNPAMHNVFMAVSIDTYDPIPSPAYSSVGLHPRYKQIVAKRLATAGMNVAYGDRSYPTSGPFPTSIAWDGGNIRIEYDQDIDYRPSNTSHFFFCSWPLSSCDSSFSQLPWSPVSPALVSQDGSRSILIADSQDQFMRIAHRLSLAFLWRESPVREYLGSSVYASDRHALPSPPWKFSVRYEMVLD